MDYCEKLAFEEAADFDYLKFLVLQMAENAKVNIFDNIFDWTELLTTKRISSEIIGNKYVPANKPHIALSDRQREPALLDRPELERCKKF